MILALLLAAGPVLVESWPAETTLDHADIPDAAKVWPEMIGGAKKTLDFGEFYLSIGAELEPSVAAVEAALDDALPSVARTQRPATMADFLRRGHRRGAEASLPGHPGRPARLAARVRAGAVAARRDTDRPRRKP